MYKLYLDGNLMYCPTVPSLSLESLNLNLELNATNVCDFLILPENPYHSRIKKRKSIIKIYDDNERIFRGIVQDSKRSFLNGLQVTCEGEMAFLRDSIQRPYEFKGSVGGFFAFMIGEHNKQMDVDRQFLVGRCTVTGSGEEIVYSDSQYLNTWESLQKKLLDEFGGYLWTRETEDGVYIDYLEDFETLNEQQVEFGKNLLDFEEVLKGAKIKTAVIPLGCKLKDEEDGAAERRLDIKRVNQGVDYVFSEEAVEKYGLIFEVVVWDDVTMPEELLQKGNAELQNYIHLMQSIEIQAVNLHNVEKDIRSFRLGNYTKVISKTHDLDEVLLTRKLDLDLLDPASGSMHLGDERKTFVDQQAENNSAVGGILEKVEKVESDFEVNKDKTEEKLDSLDKFVISSAEPEDKTKLWCDTSENPSVLKRWNGEFWEVVNDQNDVVNQIYEQVYSAIRQASDHVTIQVGESYYQKGDVNSLLSSMRTEYKQYLFSKEHRGENISESGLANGIVDNSDWI